MKEWKDLKMKEEMIAEGRGDKSVTAARLTRANQCDFSIHQSHQQLGCL